MHACVRAPTSLCRCLQLAFMAKNQIEDRMYNSQYNTPILNSSQPTYYVASQVRRGAMAHAWGRGTDAGGHVQACMPHFSA